MAITNAFFMEGRGEGIETGSEVPSWYCRPNPEDRINRKTEDQKVPNYRKSQKPQDQICSTVLNLIFGPSYISSILKC